MVELQFSYFNREPSAEETSLAKWEGYAALAANMQKNATVVSIDNDAEDSTGERADPESDPSDVQVPVDSSKISTLLLLR